MTAVVNGAHTVYAAKIIIHDSACYSETIYLNACSQKFEYFLPEVEADLVLLLLVAACWPASAAAFWPTLPKVELFSWSVTIAILGL